MRERDLAAPAGDEAHLTRPDVWAIAADPAGMGAAGGGRAGRHLATCERCRERLARARAEDARAAELLSALDVPVPPITLEQVKFRARVGGRPVARSWRPRGVRAALTAGAVLAAGAAAAALPSSPLRAYLADWIGGTPTVASRGRPGLRPVAAPATPVGTAPPARQGVTITPASTLTVAFDAPQRAGVIRVTVDTGARASVTAYGGNAPRFSVAHDRIGVTNAGDTASYDVVVPRALVAARVTVAGRDVFAWRAGALVTPLRRDAAGRYLVPLPTIMEAPQ